MSLPESKQDASLANTYEARPGVSDATPAGVSSSDSQDVSSSVKSSLDAVADSSTSTQSVSEKLPSAQAAADAVKSGVSSLLAGVSNLALGAKDTVAENASATHPESDDAQKVDDLHIPGAFEDATSDSEDIAVLKDGAKSAYNTLPSTQDIKSSLPDTKPISKQIPSMQDVKKSMPDTESVSKQMPSNPLGSLTNQSQSQQGTSQATGPLDGTSQQGQVHKEGIDHIKQQLGGQSADSLGGNSPQGRIHQDGIAHIKEQITTPHINSAGPDSTTGRLAGQVPLEPRGVPQIVAESQREAGVSPEAATNPEAVQDKKQLEQELKREVPESNTSSSGPTGTTAGLDRGVPQVVVDSQKKADASPEASANSYAVHDKQEVERELKREITPQDSTDNTRSASTSVGQAMTGGLASAGAAIAGAATYARQKTHEATGTDPVAVLPSSAQQAIDGKSASGTSSQGVAKGQSTGQSVTDSLAAGAASVGSAAAGAATFVREKTHEATGTDPVAVLPRSAQQAIDGDSASSTSATTGQSTAQSVTGSLSAGAASVGSATAGAASFAREKTHEVTGKDPVAGLPASVQRSIDESNATSSPSYGSAPASDTPVGGRVTSGSHSGVDLHAGVHNGVVGDHLDDDSTASHRVSSGSHSGHWQPGTSATVAHIPSVRDVDLSAGVKNTVVGSGADTSHDSTL